MALNAEDAARVAQYYRSVEVCRHEESLVAWPDNFLEIWQATISNACPFSDWPASTYTSLFRRSRPPRRTKPVFSACGEVHQRQRCRLFWRWWQAARRIPTTAITLRRAPRRILPPPVPDSQTRPPLCAVCPFISGRAPWRTRQQPYYRST